MRGDLQLGVARAASSEDSVQEPALRAGQRILAIARAEDPVALAGVVLDLEVVPHGVSSAIALPPFAEDALGAVGPLHAPAHAAPGEGRRVDDRAAAPPSRSARDGRAGATAAASGRASSRRSRAPAPGCGAPSARARRSRPARCDRDCVSPTRLARRSIRPETSGSRLFDQRSRPSASARAARPRWPQAS